MIKSGKTLLVFGSRNCLPCLDLSEKILRLGADQNAIVNLDVDLDADLFREYGVFTLPVLVLLGKTGKEEKRSVGDITVNKLREFLAH